MTQLVLLGLRLVLALTNYMREKSLMDAGADREIARASAAILLQTQSAKATMLEVMAMTDAQVDAALRALEPK